MIINGVLYLREKKAMSQNVQYSKKLYMGVAPSASCPPSHSAQGMFLITKYRKPTLFTRLILDIGQIFIANKIRWLLRSLGREDKD